MTCIVGDSWDQQDKTPDLTPLEDTEQSAAARPSVDDALRVPAERSTLSPAGRQPSLIPRPVHSLPLVDDDDGGGSRRSSLRGRSADLDVGSPITVDAIRRMRRKRSRGDRTRRRERSLARLSKTGELLPPVEKTEYVDAGGNRVTRYRASPPTLFPKLPHIDQTRPASDDDDDVGSLFQFRSSRLDPSQTSLKGFVDDEEEFQKIVSSRTSTPGKLRSMLVESGIGSAKTAMEEQPMLEEAVADFAETPSAKRLSYSVQLTDDDAAAEIADVEPPLPSQAAAFSPSIVPRSSLEARTTWTSPFEEPAVSRASVDTVVPPAPGSKFVTALSVPPGKSAVELERIRESFSSTSVAAADLPSQPSSTTSKAALLHQRRAGDAATPDVPAQPSSSKQVRRSSLLDVSDVPTQPSSSKQARRSSLLDVSDVPTQPSVTKASRKPLAPSLDDIVKQRMRILQRPPDDGYTPMLQTPLADSGWETVYEEDLAQGSKPYPFYRTPLMSSSLRTPSPPPRAKTRRSWARAPPGGWAQQSQRRYSVPRLSPPKFIQRPVSEILTALSFSVDFPDAVSVNAPREEVRWVCRTQKNSILEYEFLLPIVMFFIF